MSEHPLQTWLDAKKDAGSRVKQRDLAKAVGCTPARITQILHYKSSPSLALAAKLSKETGIPTEEFVVEAAE